MKDILNRMIGSSITLAANLLWALKKRICQQNGVVHNVNHSNSNSQRCLLLYITQPFISRTISDRHQNQWQAVEMARIIGDKGYVVDVVDFNNDQAILKYKYDMIIGLIPRGIDIYSKNMNPNCIRIAYLTSMNLSVTSKNEQDRIDDLKRRRGISLKPRRFAGYIQQEIEQFNAVWYIGNSYNFHSYDCFQMPPAYRIKNSGYYFSWFDNKIIRDPHNFLFFGSLGQVHKGLDLLLEIFSECIKDCTLYVCSGYEQEKDFTKAYHKELFQTPNIKPMGFVDINSSIFKSIVNQCAYTILPSCAEGCAGSILTTMSAGMIPIVSNVCGFDEDEVITLPDCSIDTICEFINEYKTKDQEWVIINSRKAVDIVNERYSKHSFTKSVEFALNSTLQQFDFFNVAN